MERDPRAFLWDVVQAADAIGAFLKGRSFTEYESDLLLRSGVERQFEIIGEALNQFSKIAPEGPASERESYGGVLLKGRFQAALERLNPTLPAEVLEEAANKVRQTELPELVAENRRLHHLMLQDVMLQDVGVETQRDDGSIGGESVRLIAFDGPGNNDWLAVNQFTVFEHGHNRRPDVVLFVNGLPIGVIELKNPANEDADLLAAFQQLQTYRAQIPSLFRDAF